MPTSVTVNQITISANATLTVQNGAVAGVVAGIVNNGVVQLNAAANSAELQTFGPATFITGSGVIQGTDTTNNRLSTHDAASTWTLGASQTLRGGLRISGTWVENDGTIEASLPSGIQLTLLNHPVAGTPSLNLGVLRAKTGSTLTLSGCQLDSKRRVPRRRRGHDLVHGRRGPVRRHPELGQRRQLHGGGKRRPLP